MNETFWRLPGNLYCYFEVEIFCRYKSDYLSAYLALSGYRCTQEIGFEMSCSISIHLLGR